MQLLLFAPLFALITTAFAQDEPAPRGLVLHELEAQAGYTLVAPLRSSATYLLDMEGRTVHQWPSELRPGNSVYLLDDGSLLRCCRVTNPVFSGGGQGGRVQRIGWDGELLWDYACSDEHRMQHHDIEPLPNGNVLMIIWESVTKAEALAAGRDPRSTSDQGLWPDAVIEVRPTDRTGGEVVWTWRAWDHLIQDVQPALAHFGDVAAHPERIDVNGDRRAQPLSAEEPQQRKEQAERLAALGYGGGADDDEDADERRRGARPDWFHTNAIDYDAARDQIVLSLRNWSEVWVIDHSTTTEEARGSGGDLLYRWGNPKRHGARGPQTLFVQHDAQWIEAGAPGAGNLLVFNNGEGRSGGRAYSSVDEFVPPRDAEGRYILEPGVAAGPAEATWSHGRRGEGRFFSGHISGAQRLPNGNTLICSGEDGRVFEVTRAGRVVWDWHNPFEPDVLDDAPPREGPEGGRAGADRRERGGRGRGPGDPRALFRATRLPADHPGLARLSAEDE